MKKVGFFVAKRSFAILCSMLLAVPVFSQSIAAPYPGAKPVEPDTIAEFYTFRTMVGRRRDGVPDEDARDFQVASFTTRDAFARVYDYLMYTGQERFQVTSNDLDPDIRTFINSLGKGELTGLARAVGSNLSGDAYRAALLAALGKAPGGVIQHGIVKKQAGDKVLYYFDLHRPILNFRTLRWIDATHITVIRIPFSLPAYTGLSSF